MEEFIDNGLRVRQIKDNEGYYIREDGVKLRRKRDGSFKYSKGSLHRRSGYIKHSMNGGQYRAHRLVAEAFIPNPSNLPMVDHIDNNSANNHIDNLRWVTNQENVQYYHAGQKPSVASPISIERELLNKVNKLASEVAYLENCLDESADRLCRHKDIVLKLLAGDILTADDMQQLRIGSIVTVNGKHFTGSGSAAAYITKQEELKGNTRNSETINKEIKRMVNGTRAYGTMYSCYAIT